MATTPAPCPHFRDGSAGGLSLSPAGRTAAFCTHPRSRFLGRAQPIMSSSTCLPRSVSTSSSDGGLLDLGYVVFYAVGAYTTAVLSSGHATGRGWQRCPSPSRRRCSRASCWSRRRCACAGTISPSSRSARRDHPHLGQQLELPRRTARGITAIPHPPDIHIPVVDWHLDFGCSMPKPTTGSA